ncbi:MAG: gamma-glutamyl-gamma-aminobutyrate hydrolase family protein [Actinomycetota bacterium]|nr:gamma-glutamyl-gamma-aminobutyrate hydrolase family protein [Actinomycetota bacterium]
MHHPPRVGLTTYREPAAWGVWNEPADLLPSTYAGAVVAAGGVAMLLPPAATDDLDASAAAVLGGLHGLALAGGADLDPQRYSAARDPHTGPPRPDRDAWELALARAALDRGVPLLAICRGMQVLNVALGGDLVQHLPDVAGHDGHLPVVGQHGRHDVRLVRESLVGSLLGECALVATYHHQAVGRLGAGLVATGWAGDDTVEAVEHTGSAWVVGVQWHPEVHDGAALFTGFVAACTRYRAELMGVGAR